MFYVPAVSVLRYMKTFISRTEPALIVGKNLCKTRNLCLRCCKRWSLYVIQATLKLDVLLHFFLLSHTLVMMYWPFSLFFFFCFAPLQLYIMKLFVMKQHISLYFSLTLFFHIFSTFCRPSFPFVSSILCALMPVIFLIPSSPVYSSSLLAAVLSSCFPEHFLSCDR